MFKGSRLGAVRRGLVFAASVAAAWAALGLGSASAAAPVRPVPSLQPGATASLWQKLVKRPRAFAQRSATADCRPLRAVFYTQTDWLRLATKLAAAAAPCVDYYISIPPLAADKTAFRYDQPWRIRALGPNFHVLAEIHMNGWATWIANNGATWYAAGQEARRRMAASGFDVASGDSWIVNELTAAVRRGDGSARANVRELVRGLYDGDGGPAVKGGVYIVGMSQATSDLSTYKANVQAWYEDTPFWNDMTAYVSDWSQELYGDVRKYAVEGSSLHERRDALEAYLQHEVTLANAGPEAIAPARAFLQSAYSPLANAAWQYESGYGWTAVPYDQMQDYVSAQTYALRSFGARTGEAFDHFGFAWVLKMPVDMTSTDFVEQTGAIADRLAAAIRDSAQSPDPTDPGIGACAPAGENVWCSTTLAGATFNGAWNTFASWSPDALGLIGTPAATAGTALPLSVQLQVAGIARPETSAVTVTLASSSAQGEFAPTADGPWASTLDVTIAAGSTEAGFYYRDTSAGTAVLTANATDRVGATLSVAVGAAALAGLTVSPASATVAAGSTQQFTATGADAYGNPVTPTPAWSVGAETPGTVSSSGLFTASAATGGSGTVVATAGDVVASASVVVTAPKLHVASIAYARATNNRLAVTFGVVRTSDTAAIAGALVSFTLYRNGYAYASGTVQTASNGYATFTTSSKAPSGCYTTTVKGVTGAGLAWDAFTPANSYCK